MYNQHQYDYHQDSYMGAHHNQQLGDFWSDLRDTFNLPDWDQAADILKKDGTKGLQKAVADGVVNSETAQQLAKEVAEEKATATLAESLRNNWKTYAMVGGGVLVVGATLIFLMGRGSR